MLPCDNGAIGWEVLRGRRSVRCSRRGRERSRETTVIIRSGACREYVEIEDERVDMSDETVGDWGMVGVRGSGWQREMRKVGNLAIA